VFFRKHPKGEHQLGVIGNLSPLWSQTLSIYEWTGHSRVDSGVYTPDFMYFATEFPLNFDTVMLQFTLVELEFDSVFPPDIVSVNTVSTHPKCLQDSTLASTL
jgi:hypothetical protein